MIYLIMSGPTKVKIGYTSNINIRIKSLQTANPVKLEVLLVLEGERKTELEWHYYYKDYRIENTEWFRVKGKLRESIRAFKTKTTNIKVVDLKTFIKAGMQYTILQKAKRNKKLAKYLKDKKLTNERLRPFNKPNG